MTTPCPALCLYRPRAQVNAIRKGQGHGRLGAAVDVGQAGQRHDVGAGDAEDGQLGQLLVVGVGGHGPP